MAQRGFAFVNPSYVFGPDVTYPGEVDQVMEYIGWVDQHANDYNLDRNNVFVEGGSACGQMAEQLDALVTNPEYMKKNGLHNVHPNVQSFLTELRKHLVK